VFIYESQLSLQENELLEDIKKKFGVVPDHFKFLLSVNPIKFKMFMQEIAYLLNHPHIESDFFIMLRLYIATKEDFEYCKSFNTKLLFAKGYDKKTIQDVKRDIENIPLDDRHKVLAKKAILAVYEPELFTVKDIDELKKLSWSDSDIYDVVDHSSFLFKNAKIIKAYTK
jgi:hypothetical protein